MNNDMSDNYDVEDVGNVTKNYDYDYDYEKYIWNRRKIDKKINKIILLKITTSSR